MDTGAPDSTPLPWDTSAGNRFAPYTDTNHSATLWIACILGMIYAFGTLFIRLFIKFKVLGPDDYLIIASSVSEHWKDGHNIGLSISSSSHWVSTLQFLNHWEMALGRPRSLCPKSSMLERYASYSISWE